MTEPVRDFLTQRTRQLFATNAGTAMHTQMQHILIDGDNTRGDNNIIAKIKDTKLDMFFGPNSRTEVPIAGITDGKFISRRIDRLIIQESEKRIIFLDYKTDVNKNILRDKYIIQMNQYLKLLQDIYPKYSINGFILWLHDFELERFC